MLTLPEIARFLNTSIHTVSVKDLMHLTEVLRTSNAMDKQELPRFMLCVKSANTNQPNKMNFQEIFGECLTCSHIQMHATN